jgi:Holliday junction resolvasome RuvABC endonuclease subunit
LPSYAGIDPSSTATALTVIGSREGLKFSKVWTRPKNAEIAEVCWDYEQWIKKQLWTVGAVCEYVGVEKLASNLNQDTTRKIAYIEGITLSAVIACNMKPLHFYATSARKLATGHGGKKQRAYDDLCERYGNQYFDQFGKQKLDVSDSTVLAIAAKRSFA